MRLSIDKQVQNLHKLKFRSIDITVTLTNTRDFPLFSIHLEQDRYENIFTYSITIVIEVGFNKLYKKPLTVPLL